MEQKKKMKLKKINYIHLAVLTAVYILLVLALTRFEYAYGSKLDWNCQHYAIPDYFRKLFYETGDFFPSFAFNIGGGENIYNLSYYGLFSPIILFSYLLPFVPMNVYIQAVSIIGVVVSLFIFYKWMLGKFSLRNTFILSVMFLFSACFIFHSHRHIMFVSYMPFLLLAFQAVENYFKGKRKYGFVVFTTLIIFTCYFYAVSAIAAIVVYGIYVYLDTTGKFSFKDFFRKGSHFAGRIITSVFLGGILLLPTVYCMLSGRDAGNSKIDLSTLMPSTDVTFWGYSSYSMGLTVFAVLAIIAAVVKNNKAQRFMGICFALLLTCPVFVFILNGGLYIDPKVLIPFMPLCLVLVGNFLKDMEEKKVRWKICLPVLMLYIACAYVFGSLSAVVMATLGADTLVVAAGIVFCILKDNRRVLEIGLYLFTAGVCAVVNFSDKLVPLSELETDTGDDIKKLADIVSSDGDVVRTANLVDRGDTINEVYNNDFLVSNIYSSLHNKRYNQFYFNGIYNENEFRNPAMTAQSQSILFQIYMSDKYLIADDETLAPYGYTKISKEGNLSLYQNDNVLPLGYVSHLTMSEREYSQLKYPYSIEALLRYTITDEGAENSFNSVISMLPALKIPTDESISLDNEVYSINTAENITRTIKLEKSVDPENILLVSFKVRNNMIGKKKDAKVLINGIKNNLTNPAWKYYNGNTTFEYALTSQDGKAINSIEMEFMAGRYEIYDIECHEMPYPYNAEEVDPFEIDKEKTNGDNIVGSIDVERDGYFNLSVPYTEGFEAYVDGKKTDVICVDTAFTGFKISKGHHEIEIRFTAPMQKEGLLMSGAGVIILIVLIAFEYPPKRRRKADETK